MELVADEMKAHEKLRSISDSFKVLQDGCAGFVSCVKILIRKLNFANFKIEVWPQPWKLWKFVDQENLASDSIIYHPCHLTSDAAITANVVISLVWQWLPGGKFFLAIRSSPSIQLSAVKILGKQEFISSSHVLKAVTKNLIHLKKSEDCELGLCLHKMDRQFSNSNSNKTQHTGPSSGDVYMCVSYRHRKKPLSLPQLIPLTSMTWSPRWIWPLLSATPPSWTLLTKRPTRVRPTMSNPNPSADWVTVTVRDFLLYTA